MRKPKKKRTGRHKGHLRLASMAHVEDVNVGEGDAVQVDLRCGLSIADVEATVRQVQIARGEGAKYFIFGIGGYDDDPRDLAEIPEVRQLCHSLVKGGLIALMDKDHLDDDEPFALLSALYVWLLSEGLMPIGPTTIDLDESTMAKFEVALEQAQKRCEALQTQGN